jgi:hypothetical protein
VSSILSSSALFLSYATSTERINGNCIRTWQFCGSQDFRGTKIRSKESLDGSQILPYSHYQIHMLILADLVREI